VLRTNYGQNGVNFPSPAFWGHFSFCEDILLLTPIFYGNVDENPPFEVDLVFTLIA